MIGTEWDMEAALEVTAEENFEKGIAQGIEKEQLKSVKSLHEYGMVAEQIAIALKLPLETVNHYLKESD